MYKTKYRIPILNPGVATYGIQGSTGYVTPENSETLFSILIQERDFSGQETMLKGNVDGAVLRYINNEENKYPEIQASELDVLFYSDTNFSLEQIITDDDFQYKVVVLMGETPVWYGWLNTDDCSEEMQADPKLVQLRATDGLGLLKNEPVYPISEYQKRTLLSTILTCLDKINLGLDLLIECSVFESRMVDREDDPANEPFSQCMVHTRSYLKNQNEYENCYDVLVRIMAAFKCTLFQSEGRWHIMRKHDRWNGGTNMGTLLPYGELIAYPTSHSYIANVDRIERHPINVDQLRGFTSAKKHTKISYSFDQPYQIPRNANFQQGAFIAPLSGVENSATSIFYWDFIAYNPSLGQTAYLNTIRDPETGTIQEYYVVVPSPPTQFGFNELRSTGVEVSMNDKLRFTAEISHKFNDPGSVAHSVVTIRLVGTDSSEWWFKKLIGYEGYTEDPKRWVNTVNPDNVVSMKIPDGSPSNDWLSVEFTTEPFPVDGTIYISFTSAYTTDFANDYRLRNVKFDWLFFINSSTSITGQYDLITKNSRLRSNTEEDVKIGDAPKKTIPGALFMANDNTKLTANWHRYGKNESEKLMRINDICLHQASHRLYTKIDGSFLGITYDNKLISPACQFYFNAIPNKHYIPTNLEISLGQNTFIARLIEFYDTTKDNGDPQGDLKLFQYIYE